MAQPGTTDDDLAREIGERLVPEITADQVIPAPAVLDALGDIPPARPDDVS
jgi:hypothetical protein